MVHVSGRKILIISLFLSLMAGLLHIEYKYRQRQSSGDLLSHQLSSSNAAVTEKKTQASISVLVAFQQLVVLLLQ